MNTANHALCFSWHRPVQGRELQAMENHAALKAYWTKQQQAGNIAHFETLMLAATGNEHAPVGMLIVTGERAKLQQLRWEDQDYLNLHAMALHTLTGFACVDAYAGDLVEKQLQRFATLLKK